MTSQFSGHVANMPIFGQRSIQKQDKNGVVCVCTCVHSVWHVGSVLARHAVHAIVQSMCARMCVHRSLS